MNRWVITLIIMAIVAAVLVVLYFLGKRAQRKQDEQEAAMEQAAQTVSLLVIDKKKMRLKDAGFPQVVMDNANLLAKRAKVPVVKAKVGPRMMVMMCDPKIFDDISGIYINRIISVRGGKVQETQQKKGFFKRIFSR